MRRIEIGGLFVDRKLSFPSVIFFANVLMRLLILVFILFDWSSLVVLMPGIILIF